jgi:glycerate-2-kinase
MSRALQRAGSRLAAGDALYELEQFEHVYLLGFGKAAAAMGLAAAAHLARHDAFPFLQASGDPLRAGPTQTNLNDLVAVFVF